MSLTNTQFDTVMRYYEEVRERNRYEQNCRTEEIYRKIPEIMSLDDQVAVRSLQAAKARIADPNADLAGYARSMKEISDKKRLLLTGHGYPANYLELQYDCPVCRDTGFTDGHRCSCFDRIASDLLYGSPALREILASEQFGRFSFGWYSDTIVDESTGLTPLKSAQHAFAVAESMFSEEGIRGNLYICGNTGVGKTFLSHCISKEAIDRGLSVLYFSSGEFFDILAGQTFDRKNRGNVVKDLISSCDLLVIDDLGTELTNSFSASSLFRVINDRIVNHKSTIISTNLSLRELSEKYSERILSRITSEYIVLKLTGEDIRILKKLNARQDSLAEEIHEF